MPDLVEAPWCVLLGTHLPLGVVPWWQPKQMLLLRSTCRALHGDSTSEFLFEVLTSGFHVKENIWRHATEGRTLYEFCRRLFAERLLIATLSCVAAAAAGLEPSDPRARRCAIVAGGFALNRYERDVEGRECDRKYSGDVDVFIPFGSSKYEDAAELERSKVVWRAVIRHVESSLLQIFTEREVGPERITINLHPGDYDYPRSDDEDLPPDDSDEERPPIQVQRYLQRLDFHKRFHAPEEPIIGHTYPLALLRRMAMGMSRVELGGALHEDEYVGDEHVLCSKLGTLLSRGMLDGDATAGLARGYRIARVIEVSANIRDSEAYESMWPVQFPTTINVIQYFGEPLEQLALVSSFDLPPPQVALRVEEGSALARFDLTAAAQEAQLTRELRLGKYTWGPCYLLPAHRFRSAADVDELPTSPRPFDILNKPVRAQLSRIDKYVDRGFRLPPAQPNL
jgi:hypothetical protein